MGALGFFIALAIVILVLIGVAKTILIVGRPNEVLVFSGGSNTTESGKTIGLSSFAFVGMS